MRQQYQSSRSTSSHAKSPHPTQSLGDANQHPHTPRLHKRLPMGCSNKDTHIMYKAREVPNHIQLRRDAPQTTHTHTLRLWKQVLYTCSSKTTLLYYLHFTHCSQASTPPTANTQSYTSAHTGTAFWPSFRPRGPAERLPGRNEGY